MAIVMDNVEERRPWTSNGFTNRRPQSSQYTDSGGENQEINSKSTSSQIIDFWAQKPILNVMDEPMEIDIAEAFGAADARTQRFASR